MTTNAIEFSFRIVYGVAGGAIYFSHLDTIKAFIRAIRRSGLPYKLTQGYHSRPKIRLGPPLPLGHASQQEIIEVILNQTMNVSEVKRLLEPQMPSGLKVIEVIELLPDQKTIWNVSHVRYRLVFIDVDCLISSKIHEFFADPDRLILTQTKQLAKTYRLGTAFEIVSEQGLNDQKRVMIIDFHQGQPLVASASKILTALVDFLGPLRENFEYFERIAILS